MTNTEEVGAPPRQSPRRWRDTANRRVHYGDSPEQLERKAATERAWADESVQHKAEHPDWETEVWPPADFAALAPNA